MPMTTMLEQNGIRGGNVDWARPTYATWNRLDFVPWERGEVVYFREK